MKLAKPEDYGFSSQRLGRINDYMQRYVDEGKAPGFVTLVARKGQVVYLDKCGYRDIENKLPFEEDTIFRFYSMTKPITSVALMMLFEQGLVRLEDPASKYIPSLKDVKISGPRGTLEPINKEITVHMLLTHTAGFGYLDGEGEVLAKGYENIWDPDQTLEAFVDRASKMPQVYQPGEKWYYSIATDIVGRLVEIISDMSLGDYFEEKIFKPLGMVDTGFSVPKEKEPRFAKLYGPVGDNLLSEISKVEGGRYDKVNIHFGGHGLVSTAEDYFRFAQMVLNKGEFEGTRFLGRRTVAYMTQNHLKPELMPLWFDYDWYGMGFGLGFSVVLDSALAVSMTPKGSIGWGGAASTNFWIDPKEEIIGILLTQIWPSYTYPTTNDFKTAVYQALVE